MKTLTIAITMAVLLLAGCGSTAPEAEFRTVAKAALGTVGEIEQTDALFTLYEHGHVVWVARPATGFYQLFPSGEARYIPDPIMEGAAYWEDKAKMAGVFGCPEKGMDPPTGGVAKLWVQDPKVWMWLGCVKQSQRGEVFTMRTRKGFVVGPFPKGTGRTDKFVIVVVGDRWRNEDIAPRAEFAKIPSILMGRQPAIIQRSSGVNSPNVVSGGNVVIVGR